MSPRAPDLTVHRMRVRAAEPPGGGARPAWRLRMGRLLDGADLRPGSLPPSAVLVVRSLAVAVPGELSGAAAPPPGRREAWARAARERLDGLRRAAARPRRGRVPSDAAALVFEDPAEWLACAVADGLRGRRDGWWWPPGLRGSGAGPSSGPSAASLTRALCQEGPRVPAVLDHLVRWGQAEATIRKLGPAGADAVLEALRRSHELGPGHGGPERARARPGARGTVVGEAGARPAFEAALRGEGYEVPGSEGARSRWVGAERDLLLLGLALHRTPFLARSPLPEDPPAPDRQLGRRDGNRASLGHPGESAGAEATDGPGGGAPARYQPASREGGGAFDGRAGSPPRRVQGGPGTSGGTGAAGPREAGVPPEGRGEGLGPRSEHPSGGPPRRAGDGTPGPHSRTAALDVLPTPQGGVGPWAPGEAPGPAGGERETGRATELGGVLFLLNLLEVLEVEEAFARWRVGGALSPWALLELLARGLLAGRPGDPGDALWGALAALDGRPAGSPPGEEVHGEGRLVLPRSWVRELVTEAEEPPGWAWAQRQGRLRVWNEVGVPVAEIDAEGDRASGAARAAELLGSLGVPGAHPGRRAFGRGPLARLEGPLARLIPPGVRPWVAFVLPFLRYRLEAALGPTPLDDVLRSPGRLFLTSSHVDLVLPLEAACLPARRAGLDRNPGWLPRAGRVVLFHFGDASHPYA